jgi:hypothetical protein
LTLKLSRRRVFQVGLPICQRRRCQAPADLIAYAVERAEDEAFALLKANWASVKRVTNALCRQDRLTTAELDDIITGRRRHRPGLKGHKLEQTA